MKLIFTYITILYFSFSLKGQQFDVIVSTGHKGDIYNIEYDEKKKIVASAGRSDVIIWDLNTSKQIAQLDLSNKNNEIFDMINQVRISPDSTWCLISLGNQIFIWDYENDSIILNVKNGTNAFFGYTGKDLIYKPYQGGTGNYIKLNIVNNDKIETTIRGKLFNSNGKLYHYQMREGFLFVEDYNSNIIEKIPFPDNLDIQSIEFSSDQKYIVAIVHPKGSYPHFKCEIFYYNRETKSVKRTKVNSEFLKCIAISPDSKYIVYPDAAIEYRVQPDMLKLIDIETGKLLKTITNPLLTNCGLDYVREIKFIGYRNDLLFACNRDIIVYNPFQEYLSKLYPRVESFITDTKMDEMRGVIYFTRSNGEIGRYNLNNHNLNLSQLKNTTIYEGAIEIIESKSMITALYDSCIFFLNSDDLSLIGKIEIINPDIFVLDLKADHLENNLLYQLTHFHNQHITSFGIIDLNQLTNLPILNNQSFEKLYFLPTGLLVGKSSSGVSIFDKSNFNLRQYYHNAELVFSDSSDERHFVFYLESDSSLKEITLFNEYFDLVNKEVYVKNIQKVNIEIINVKTKELIKTIELPPYDLSKLNFKIENKEIVFSDSNLEPVFKLKSDEEPTIEFLKNPSERIHNHDIEHFVLRREDDFLYAIQPPSILYTYNEKGESEEKAFMSLIKINIHNDSIYDSHSYILNGPYDDGNIIFLNDSLFLINSSNQRLISIFSFNHHDFEINFHTDLNLTIKQYSQTFNKITTATMIDNKIIVSGYLKNYRSYISRTILISFEDNFKNQVINWNVGFPGVYGDFSTKDNQNLSFYPQLSDNRTEIYLKDKKNHQELFKLFLPNTNDWMIIDKLNRYYSSKGALEYIGIKKNKNIYSFEQFDVYNHRPDIIKKEIGLASENEINSYHRAWLKRVQKLGIDTTSFEEGFSLPESDFLNRAQIEYEQKGNLLTLKVWGKDADYMLDRYNVWVNEVPVFGQRGVNFRDKNLNEINTTITIDLSDGDNKIETSVLNVNGIESYRVPLYVRYNPSQPSPEKLHYVGIGVDRYQQPGHDLKYSAKDIRDLSKALKNKYGNTILIDTLFDENVTRENVLALKKKLNQTTVNDKVIISFSGHGLLDSKYDYYLATHTVDFKNPSVSGLAYEDLEWLLDSIPARKKLLLMDACHSGEVDKEELMAIQADKPEGTKGAELEYEYAPTLGMKNSFELMQELFTNVNRGTGATIISAAGGTQFAYEKGNLQNGVFTYSILELMNQKDEINVSELKTKVGERVTQLTNGLQKPTSRNETIEFDWRVW